MDRYANQQCQAVGISVAKAPEEGLMVVLEDGLHSSRCVESLLAEIEGRLFGSNPAQDGSCEPMGPQSIHDQASAISYSTRRAVQLCELILGRM